MAGDAHYVAPKHQQADSRSRALDPPAGPPPRPMAGGYGRFAQGRRAIAPRVFGVIPAATLSHCIPGHRNAWSYKWPRLRLSWDVGALPRRGSGWSGRKIGKPSLYAGTCGILRPLAQCGSSVTTTNARSPGSAKQETHSVAPACLRTNQPIMIMTVVIVSSVCRDPNRGCSSLIDVGP